jgi:hypothetical protein
MINKSTDVIKANIHLSPNLIEHLKKITGHTCMAMEIYIVGPDLEQAQILAGLNG